MKTRKTTPIQALRYLYSVFHDDLDVLALYARGTVRGPGTRDRGVLQARMDAKRIAAEVIKEHGGFSGKGGMP